MKAQFGIGLRRKWDTLCGASFKIATDKITPGRIATDKITPAKIASAKIAPGRNASSKIKSGRIATVTVATVTVATTTIALSSIWIQSASGFSSFKSAGGEIHHSIARDALSPLGVSSGSLQAIKKGMNSQDNPFSRKWTIAENHACDNKIDEAFKYIEDRTTEAVRLAAGAETSKRSREDSLYCFGEGLHTLHDFYSHANYVEWLIRHGKPMEPISRSNRPAEIRTCYYMYRSALKQEPFCSHEKNVEYLKETYPGTSFRSENEYKSRAESDDLEEAIDYALRPGQLLHMELSKDNPRELEGRIVAPKYGKTLHRLAYELAVQDTKAQWLTFEKLMKAKYGERAAGLIGALKGDTKGKDPAREEQAPDRDNAIIDRNDENDPGDEDERTSGDEEHEPEDQENEGDDDDHDN